MAKPIHLRMVGGKEPRQHMWEAVRDNRQGFTPRLIAELSGQPEGSVRTYITALNKSAYIELVDGKGVFADRRWRLVRDEGAESPRVTASGERSKHGVVLENLWRTLRIMGEMTAAQAAEMASIGGVEVAQAYAHNYFTSLSRAGYLIVCNPDSLDPKVFRLAPGLSTGPRHPVVQRTVTFQVFDPNLNKVVFSSVESGGVWSESTPSNDMLEQNTRLKKLLAEFVAAGQKSANKDLLQRAQLELA